MSIKSFCAALSALAFVVVAAPQAFSQSAMTPGGGAMAPQPRVAPTVVPPAAPQAPVMTPPVPFVAPQMPVATQPIPQPSTRNTTSSSNRDHIDQDAQTDIKKLRVINNSETEGQYSRTTGNVYGGVDIGVMKQGQRSSSIPTSKTDGSGQITFRQLEPGTYSVQFPNAGPQGGTVSMTTFVNGKLASRTEFPVGSSVGTFAVASAKDTITLKFESNSQPVNGIGGQGGGRFTKN